MKCPSCTNPDLIVTTRHRIEIDLCPRCRGIWLDRGELDKIVARSERGSDTDDDGSEDDRDPPRTRGRDSDHAPRRRSWWAELLD